MNDILEFLKAPVGGALIALITSYVATVAFDVRKRRKDAARSAAEHLGTIREKRLTAPPWEPRDIAKTLAALRAYAFIARLDVLANRRLLWSFAILVIETISFTATGPPAGAFAWATYVASTGFAVTFMLSAFSMTRRATVEYRALISSGSLDRDEITRLRDFMLP